MTKQIQEMSSRTKNILFGTMYAILLLFAVFPPFYLWGSGNQMLFLGAPFSMWYWIADFVLLLAVMFGYYRVESIRGEVDPESMQQTVSAEAGR